MKSWTTSEIYSSVMNVHRLGGTKKERSKHSRLVLGWMGKCPGFQGTLEDSELGEDSGRQKPREGRERK